MILHDSKLLLIYFSSGKKKSVKKSKSKSSKIEESTPVEETSIELTEEATPAVPSEPTKVNIYY